MTGCYMTKEIIVNAGEMEARVAILENGRLMELHIEREPKIVGNIYKGRVTKVLKGMDAAFVDIGVELNAFLSVSDVVPETDEDEGNGRHGRRELPPITQLLHANQEILAQVVRAPMGSKGARITTRLSVPGRYMVLMLNSGSYVGVSRKIEDPKERQRLRALANAVRPENYSVIVRTEAEGKTEEELRGDLAFLLDMAKRLETKAEHAPAPSLVHGDMNLVLRLIRDAFTRDVNRVVVDSPESFENIIELVELLSPHLKNRIFLYDEPMPIFHAYNIELEIERTLRRKVWLPSGGSIVVDQAEALTAIDVNTGRFVGSVELAETVLTTNLQAAEEVARQLRLRDLGGIIVVDFIDMDNLKHRQQVSKAFEEALKRDRAKIKVHSISALGLVEMTRKRTGESLNGMLTEACPYCSGIGRVQNVITMALRIQRDLAATAVEHPNTEAFVITAHPRIVASILGYEGEIQRDLEQYIGHPVYLRSAEGFHPNTYQLERMTLEQVLLAVSHLEEGEEIEGRVVNPDPTLSLSPLVQARGIYIVVPDLDAPIGAMVKVRVMQTGTSLAFADPLAPELRGIRTEQRPHAIERPPLLAESVLPPYLREERQAKPPRGQHLLSPTAAAVPHPVGEDDSLVVAPERYTERRTRKRRTRPETEALAVPQEIMVAAVSEPVVEEALAAEVEDAQPLEAETLSSGEARRKRRRRRGRGGSRTEQAEIATEAQEETIAVPVTEQGAVTEESAEVTATTGEAAPETPLSRSARRRRARARRRREGPREEFTPSFEPPMPVPILEPISPEEAAEALTALLNAIPEAEEEIEPQPVEAMATPAETMGEATAAPAEAKPARRPRTRRPRKTAEAPEETPVTPGETHAPVTIAMPDPVAETPVPAEVAPAEARPRRRRTPTPRRKKTEPEGEAPQSE